MAVSCLAFFFPSCSFRLCLTHTHRHTLLSPPTRFLCNSAIGQVLCSGLHSLFDPWISPVCPSVQISHFFLLITFCLTVRRLVDTDLGLFEEILRSSCRPWRINKLPPDEEKCRLLLSRFPQAPECNFTLIMLL